jgi:hypothetical protein
MTRMMHELPECFDERNMFLLSVLGLLSVGERLDGLMATRGRRLRRPARASPAEDRGRDHLLHALLGVLSLSQTVRVHAHAARREADGRPPRSRQPARLLRRLLV